MDFDLVVNILFATIRTGTPLILIALGEMVCEKSGVLNLGQEGMVLMGAVAGFMAAVVTGHPGLGVLAAMAAGMLMSLLFGFLAISLVTSQVATGLALTIFGTGLSAFLGASYVGVGIEGIGAWTVPLLSEIPVIGKILFSHDPLVYLSWALFGLVYFCFKSTRIGLIVRSVGENPEAANAIGMSVFKVRYGAVLFGGAMAGLAGGYLSLAYTPLWTEGMSAGRGWIALALVVFASWRAERVLLGAYLFGAASIMHLVLQGLGFEASPNLLAMLPYVATIVVLVVLANDAVKTRLNTPMALGKPYRPQL
ncbi:MAG: ABC transporter permease [Pseudomonadales bacterium]|uniref:ABC-type transport system, permease component n=1 Tax=Oleiphilus messinensis TaxID=141451 RepID=A0A1Y0ID80_9GAMM|nr:ABC transporter permease [Oleiphilus messinensis]ARU57726.1 ABC-type transport system, permease component [Oleiphilus messinensis]MCG8610627.1 ABC transporter permease [Pseudomonadales bacterium]